MEKVLVVTNNNQGFLSYLQTVNQSSDLYCQYCEYELEVFEYIIKHDISLLLIEDTKIHDILSCVQRYLLLKPDLIIVVLVDSGNFKLRIDLLKAGIDRCLVKPIEYEELLANLHSITRKQHSLNTDGFSFPSWQLIKNHWILVAPNHKQMKLTAREFHFIYELFLNPGKAVDRSTVIDIVLGKCMQDHDIKLNKVLANLRKKSVELLDHELPVKTIHTVGYAFVSNAEIK
ncbi:MAG: winged helix-turn-helix domain-containing protein [Methylomonas sp.]